VPKANRVGTGDADPLTGGDGLLAGETIPTIRQAPPKLQAKPRGGRRSHPEQAIQRAIIDHLKWRAVPGCFYFHCPNGGLRTAIEGAILRWVKSRQIAYAKSRAVA
jgi:hypothetical protein